MRAAAGYPELCYLMRDPMNLKSIAKGLLVLNILALIVTAALAWGLDRSASTELLDLVTYVGLGMGALGALMFIGSTSGSSGSTGMAASAAEQPSRIMEALWIDRSAGISTGALLVLGGVIWLGLGWLGITLLSHLQA
jgi:hypothetical protein